MCLGFWLFIRTRPLLILHINGKYFTNNQTRCPIHWKTSSCEKPWFKKQKQKKVTWCCRTIPSKVIPLLILILGTEEPALFSVTRLRSSSQPCLSWIKSLSCPQAILGYPIIWGWEAHAEKSISLNNNRKVVPKIYMRLFIIYSSLIFSHAYLSLSCPHDSRVLVTYPHYTRELYRHSFNLHKNQPVRHII